MVHLVVSIFFFKKKKIYIYSRVILHKIALPNALGSLLRYEQHLIRISSIAPPGGLMTSMTPKCNSKRHSFTVLSLTVSFIFRWMNRSVSFCKPSDARWILNTCSALWELWAQFSTSWLLWWYICTRLCDPHTDSLTNDTMQTSLSVPVKDRFCLCCAIYIYFPEKKCTASLVNVFLHVAPLTNSLIAYPFATFES